MSTYLLLMMASARHRIKVGALGEVDLSPGCYLYVGSARRALAPRIRRHGRSDKKRRWHIDYLLDGEALRLEGIWVGSQISECRLAAGLLACPGVTIPRTRLGASDCRCPSHFLRFDQPRAYLKKYLRNLGLSVYFPA